MKFCFCVLKPFRTHIGKLLICNTAEVIEEIFSHFIFLCGFPYFFKRKRVGNILSAGIAVGIVINPSYALILTVNKKRIFIAGIRAFILCVFGVIFGFFFTCNSLFFRR